MIYFIQSEKGGPIKIGYATDVQRRMRVLQEGNPCKLVCLATKDGDQKDEYRLHKKFEPYQIRSEWYEPSVELLNFIENMDSFDLEVLYEEHRRKQKKNTFDYIAFFEGVSSQVKNENMDFQDAMDFIINEFRKGLEKFGHKPWRIEKTIQSYISIVQKVASREWCPRKSGTQAEPKRKEKRVNSELL